MPVLAALGSVDQRRTRAFGLVLGALAGVSFYTSISGVVKAELFPRAGSRARRRPLVCGRQCAFGGTAEYVALWFKSVGLEPTFFWYVTVLAAVSLTAAVLMPDTRRHGLMTEEEERYLEATT